MKSFKITALSLVLVLLLAACGAKNDTPDEPAVDPTPEPPIDVILLYSDTGISVTMSTPSPSL